MKTHQLFKLSFALIATFSLFNVQRALGQSITTAATSDASDSSVTPTSDASDLAATTAIPLSVSDFSAQDVGPSDPDAVDTVIDGMDMGNTDLYWQDVKGGPFEYTGVTRTYYIAAEEDVWDYAPNPIDELTGEAYDANAQTFIVPGPEQIGSKNIKCLYREYTNDKFNQRKARPASEAYLGLLGPVVRGEVGDIIKIVYINNCRMPTSVHPHAVFYNKDSEGAPYNDNTSGFNRSDDAVPTGGRHTYTWLVPGRAGPGPMDGTSVMWMYHSHTNENTDFYAGLIGVMEVTAKGWAKPDGSPKDVDKEVFIMYSIMDEGQTVYLADNFAKFSTSTTPDVLPTTAAFTASNQKYSINGYIYGNQPMITLHKGDRVRWYVMSMGQFVDDHTPQWHGNTVVMMGMRMDVVSVQPAEMVTADMRPDNAGIWLFHCHFGNHIQNGMTTRYEVKACNKS